MAHRPQPAIIRGGAGSESLLSGVLDAVVPTSRLYDVRQRRIVHETDVREQVVLNLRIQSAEHARQQPAFAGKVHGGLYPMDGPGVFYSACVALWQDESRLFYQ
ncbi:MAG TPA: hypothetical protein VK395_20475 [Gemmataceae bacterium]|nr:hypothetical protein [Gemmataceae bacterium]